jgi:uncharacterized protein (DUF697 family)
METNSRRLTRKYAMISAAISVVAHPIPAADELLVIPVHYRLSMKMARAQGARLRDLPWRQLHKIIWGGAAVRFCFDVGFGFVPVAGALAHAATAGALTEILGRYLDEALRRPGPPPPMTLKTLKDSLRPKVAPASPETRGEAGAHRGFLRFIRGKAA